MSYRIIIAEDHALLRQGLRAMLSTVTDFEVIREASDGRSAVRDVDQLRPDLILLNLMMPGMNGIEAISHIKRRNPDTKVIALATLKSDEYIREVLKAGVDGYVIEDASYEELLVAIRSVLNGKKFLSPDVSNHVVSSFLNGSAPTRITGGLSALTLRERSVLKLVAEGHTNRTTAEFLSLSPKTVEKHRAKVMRKLGLRNAAELIYVALELGLIERPGYAAALSGSSDHGMHPSLI
jgi:DNA-binding NarL/FixJ family response regulator